MTLTEVFKKLDKINNVNDCQYLDCQCHSILNVEWYQKILEKVLELKDKPKRVVDIGSNLNQYAYLFENEGIDYVGIDLNTRFNPYVSEHTSFVNERYQDVKEDYKDDVIISCLCVGYFIKPSEVKAKHLIINDLTPDQKQCLAKVCW